MNEKCLAIMPHNNPPVMDINIWAHDIHEPKHTIIGVMYLGVGLKLGVELDKIIGQGIRVTVEAGFLIREPMLCLEATIANVEFGKEECLVALVHCKRLPLPQ